ncbi:MAG: hypothetical protein AAFY56_06335 [Pseudomonadota bacterium]
MRFGHILARISMVAGFVTAGLVGVSPASAEEQQSVGGLPCHAYGELADQLDQKYRETPVSMGIQSNGNLLQVFSSADSDTWTILSIAPSGRTCVIAAGKTWERFEPRAAGPEA